MKYKTWTKVIEKWNDVHESSAREKKKIVKTAATRAVWRVGVVCRSVNFDLVHIFERRNDVAG